MKSNKRTLSLILAAIILAAQMTMTSCSGDNDSDKTSESTSEESKSEDTAATEETEAETEDESLRDDLPINMKDYDGYTYTVLGCDYPSGSVAWKIIDISADNLTGERVNDAVFERNAKIEDRFGVRVAQNLQTDPIEYAKQSAMSSSDFDIIQHDVRNLAAMSAEGYFLDLNQIKYIDLDKVWWDKTANDSLSVLGHTYYAIGDSQLNAKKATWTVLFNKKLISDAGVPDLYTEVKEGRWTLDSLKAYGGMIDKDSNGNGEMTWGEDVFGIGLQSDISLPILMGMGNKISDIDEEGSFVYKFDSEENVNALEKIWRFFNENNSGILNCNAYNGMPNQWIEFRNLFMADQIGFYMGHLGTVVLVGGDMQSDFGILPLPKVNEEQQDYCSSFQYYHADAVAVMKTSENTDRTGLITEAYQMFAHDTVLPAFYHYTLTLRNARDVESGEMLDLIFKRRNLDLVFAYDNLTGMEEFITEVSTADTFKFASAETARKRIVNSQMKKIIEELRNAE